MKLASLSTGTLRAFLLTLSRLGVLPRQRTAIKQELALRAWAETIERTIADARRQALRWTTRGGLS